MEFKELIEARRSVRKYEPSEISKDEMSAIVGEALDAPSWKNTEVTRRYAAISAERPPNPPSSRRGSRSVKCWRFRRCASGGVSWRCRRETI